MASVLDVQVLDWRNFGSAVWMYAEEAVANQCRYFSTWDLHRATSSGKYQPFGPHEPAMITYKNTPILRTHSWDFCAQEASQFTSLPSTAAVLWMLAKVKSKILQYSFTSWIEFFKFTQTPPASCFPTFDIHCSYQYATSLRNLNYYAAQDNTHLVYSSVA